MVLSRLMKNRKMRSGQAIVLIALSMVLLLAVVALGIDGSKFYSQRRVAQNTADEAALAGIYYYEQNSSTATDATISSEINRVVQLDVTGAGNLGGLTPTWSAAWYNSSGSPITGSTFYSSCTGVSPASACNPPSGAMAIRVTVDIPYYTFLGGFVGQSKVTAEANATARMVTSNTSSSSSGVKQSVALGGASCYGTPQGSNPIPPAVEFNFIDGQNTEFIAGAKINGTLYVGSEGGGNTTTGSNGQHGTTPQQAYFEVDGNAYSTYWTNNAAGTNFPTTTSSNQAPFNSSQGMAFVTGSGMGASEYYAHYGNVATSTDPALPAWAYYPESKAGNSAYLVTAATFNPSSSNTSQWYADFQKYADSTKYRIKSITGDASSPFGGTNSSPIYNNPAYTAQAAIDTDYNLPANSGMNTIYYIAGNLTVTNKYSWPNATLIATGKIVFNNNNDTFGTAGIWALNITALAGADLTNTPDSSNNNDIPRCAADSRYTVLGVETNANFFPGVLYVPFGQVNFAGNNSANSMNTKAIVAYSFSLGNPGNKANNWFFDFDPTILVQPTITVQLMGP